MVSSEVKKKLELAFDELARNVINVNEYGGDLHDVAFDLSTTESFIAGIADRILSGDSMTNEEQAVIAKPFLLDETFWTTSEGLRADLRGHENLINLAEKIEKVRKICVKLG